MKIYPTTSNGTFLLLKDNLSLEIRWGKSPDSLIMFANEVKDALKNQDIKAMGSLLNKYELISARNIYLISEVFYPDLFTELVLYSGKSAINQGKRFSRKSFCRQISKRKSYLGLEIHQLELLTKAMEQFIDYTTGLLSDAFSQNEFTIVHKIVKVLTFNMFINLAWTRLQPQFKCYIEACANELLLRKKEITWKGIWDQAIHSQQVFLTEKLNVEISTHVTQLVNHWRDRQMNLKNKPQIELGNILWVIPSKDIQVIRTTTIDFTDMNPILLYELQEYLLDWYSKGSKGKDIARRSFHIQAIDLAIRLSRINYQSFLDISYPEVLLIVDLLHQQKKSGKRKYRIKTIHTHISEARLLFDWLCKKKSETLIKNPFRRFKMHNVDGFVKNAEYIPEYVIDQISSAIYDCSETVQRVWTILMNTGLRAHEIINLEEDCLYYDTKDSCYYLKTFSSKTLNAKRKKGLDDHHTIPIISKQVVEIIKKQIAETLEFRKQSNSKYIFIRPSNDNRKTDHAPVTRFTGINISAAINKCIRRNNINDHEGQLWHYTNHQCRKTMGVRLLTEGSSIQDVGVILGHIEEKTTRQYYQDVDNLKIAEMDHELFEALFDSIEVDVRNAYSSVELETLKREIMIGSRETPEGHGSCLKHVSFGPCKKKSCVGCSLLLTGPQKLNMWRKLRDEQSKYLESLANSMIAQGVQDYKTYRDYQQEDHLLNLYQDTINKIEKFILERLPNYESN
ncbi:site-specific integrase [Paenibacillus sp. M-152]|uniref:site-specific integrase n=1 Tax=Paenibacillus sp. M-152 TaxID=2487928 RepID=UPI000F70D801|nr:site-specific integrase [Paenibacillus sp. M-152]AZH30116.1 site-specific integrase [Paenibacillus sp. M-152]